MLINRSTLGRVGIWARELRFDPDPAAIADAAAELDEHGWGALWIPDVGGDVFGAVDVLLDATRSATIATGILNIWMHDPEEVARETNRRWESGRFVPGPRRRATRRWSTATRSRTRRCAEYLDALDAAAPPVPDGTRLLAALGPKMVALSGDRAAGAHPYLVTVEHTRAAREALGPDAVLAPELGVVLDSRRRAGPRPSPASTSPTTSTLPNYANSLRRLGFGDDDLRDGGSDRLVDAVVAVGDEEAIRARVEEHLDAGADHVCIQVVGPMGQPLPRETWRRLAPVLL